MMSLTDPLLSSVEPTGSLSSSNDARPKSFLHDEMNEFNLIFSELVASPQRRWPFRDSGLLPFKSPTSSPSPSTTEADTQGSLSPVIHKTLKDEKSNIPSHGLLRIKSAPLGLEVRETIPDVATDSVPSLNETLEEGNPGLSIEPVSCIPSPINKDVVASPISEDVVAELRGKDAQTHSPPRRHSEGSCVTIAGGCKAPSSSAGPRSKGFGSLDALECNGLPEDAGKICDPMNEVIYLNKRGNMLQ